MIGKILVYPSLLLRFLSEKASPSSAYRKIELIPAVFEYEISTLNTKTFLNTENGFRCKDKFCY